MQIWPILYLKKAFEYVRKYHKISRNHGLKIKADKTPVLSKQIKSIKEKFVKQLRKAAKKVLFKLPGPAPRA